jgi:transposase
MYRTGDRNQITLMPPSVEDYVSSDNPVRAYDAFIEAMNLNDLGIKLEDDKVGNPCYHPKAMLKLFVYGTSYGVRSSRKLEREAVNNLSFIWLLGGLMPDHKTISEFRRNNKIALKNVLKHCAQLCIDLDLIEGNMLFVDGTKINANSGIKSNWNSKRCTKALKHIDERITKILAECEQADADEENEASHVHMKKELTDTKVFREKVEQILETLKKENKTQLNTVDPDCRAMSSTKGVHPAYNNQIVVDNKNGFIVSTETNNEGCDLKQFASQIEQANEILKEPCSIACADTGYSSIDEMEKVESQNIKVIVPEREERDSQKQLTYNSKDDCFICEAGNKLVPVGLTAEGKSKVYRIEKASICKACKKCTQAEHGRSASRLLKEDLRQKLHKQYKSKEGKDIYALRRQKAEHPFGHIKRNLKFEAFLLRGLDGVKAEFSIASCCFNIARAITILGVPGLITKLRAI